MNESVRDWSPNKDRGRQRKGSEDDGDEDFMHALTHSPSQQDHAHTQHTTQASPKQHPKHASPAWEAWQTWQTLQC